MSYEPNDTARINYCLSDGIFSVHILDAQTRYSAGLAVNSTSLENAVHAFVLVALPTLVF